MDEMDAPVKVIVAPLTPGEEPRWRAFLDESAQGTFYHDPAFSAIYAAKARRVVNLVFKEENDPVAVLTGAVVDAEHGPELRSPFSSSFGGFALRGRLTLRQLVSVVSELEAWARQEGVLRVVLQHPPAPYDETLDESLELALRHGGFEPAGAELTYYLTALDVDPVVRRNLRRAAAAGCEFRETDDVTGVWEFLAAEKAERGQPFDLRRDDLVRLRTTFPGRVHTFEVVQGGVRVAALLAYALSRRAVLGFHWAQRAEAQASRPTDLLIHESARWVFEHGFQVYDLGTVTLGGLPVWGVTQFKEKFRPRGALRRRFSRRCA